MVQLTPDDITDTVENELWEGLACYDFRPRIFWGENVYGGCLRSPIFFFLLFVFFSPPRLPKLVM